MSQLYVSLFGKMSIAYQEDVITSNASGKAQELFSYLLLHRNRTHSRERLAGMLWGDYCTTTQSKKYLRKALWQLQSALGKLPLFSTPDLLETESEWIKLNQVDDLRLDVAIFEEAYEAVSDIAGGDLTRDQVAAVEEAIGCYRGELLENWYYEWCLVERERLHELWLRMLYKLMVHAETHQLYEKGIEYGMEILKFDSAHEQTHRCMMRLMYRLGDRTSAIRQYNRCVEMLEEELGVKPAPQTISLYEQIKEGRLQPGAEQALVTTSGPAPLARAEFQQLKVNLLAIQNQIAHTLQGVETRLSNWQEAE